MANNDILEIFEMVGTVAIDVAKSMRELNSLERQGQETADSLQDDFERAFQSISRLSATPEIDINSESSLAEIQAFRATFEKMLDDLNANGQIDFDTDPAVRDLQALRLQAESLERMFNGTEGTVEVDAAQARRTLNEMTSQAAQLRSTLNQQQYRVSVNGSEAIGPLQQIIDLAQRADQALNRLRDRFANLNIERTITETVNRVVNTTYNSADDPGVVGPQTSPSGEPQSNAPPMDGGYNPSVNDAAILGATGAAAYGLGAVGAAGNAAARRVNRFGYDLNRVNRSIEAYHRKMLDYAMRLTPQNALGTARERIEISMPGFDYLKDSKNMLQLQATFSMIEQGALAARRQLSQLGFGRTKAEIKALEGQLYTMGNVRLDNLKDQIKLTEKAITDLKKSANADEYIDDIRKLETALAGYKNQLKDANPFEQMAKANGYGAANIFGKDVFYKPFSNALDRMGGRIVAFANRDLAYLQNKTYEAIDNAATKIVGPQTTKAETKMKINQLAMRYQMFGQQLNTFVTPAVLGLAAAFGMVAANAQKGWGKFEAQTLQANEEMVEFKNLIADTSAETGSSIEQTGELFSILFNQMGRTKDNIQEAAEIGLNFAKVWGVDAADAVSSVDMIVRELGVTQEEAADILALALKKHQGDIEAATDDVYENQKAWQDQAGTMIDGMTAYQKMVEGIDNNGISASGTALRKMGNSLLELWKALEPTVIRFANAVSRAADAMTAFLRENPGLASLIAHFTAFAGIGLLLLGALMPLASLMIRFRGLFQGMAQGLGLAGKGAVVLSPQVRMLVDSMTMLRNGIIGLPRLFRSLFPGILSFLRALPGMVAGFVVQFIRMNPILSAISAISWVIYKNWEKFEPVLARIWDSLKRIGNSIIEAFAGPGKTGAEGFNIIMDDLAKFLGDVLLPIFEVLAVMLEMLAAVMEGGGGKMVAFGMAGMFILSVVGKMIPGLGLLGNLFGLVGGKASKGGGAIKAFGLIFSGLGGMISKAAPVVARAAGGLFKFIPTLFRGVGGMLLRFGAMLLPLLANPFVLAGVAIGAAIIGIGVVIYRNWDKIKSGFSRKVRQLTSWLKRNWALIPMIFGGPLVAAATLIFKNFDKIKAAVARGARAVINAAKRAFGNFGREVMKTFRWQFGNVARELGPLGDFLKKVVIGIFKGFPILIGKALRSMGRIASSAFGFMSRVIQNRLALIRRLISTFAGFLRRSLPAAFRFIRNVISNIMGAIARTIQGRINFIRRVFSAGIAFLRRVASTGFAFIRRVITSAMQAVGRIVSSILNSMRRAFSSAMRFIRTVVGGAFRAVYNGIRNALNNAITFVRNALNRIRNFFTGFAKNAYSWGADILRGLVNGIKNGVGAAKEAIEEAGKAIMKAFKKVMGIKSPSRVFQVLGQFIPEGAANGIRRGIGFVRRATEDMADATRASFKSKAEVQMEANVTGNPVDSLRNQLGGLVKARGRLNAVIPTRQSMQFDQRNRAQMNNVESVNVNVQKLVDKADYADMARKVQREITDNTNKEVRRRI